jgi:hypothetical protein
LLRELTLKAPCAPATYDEVLGAAHAVCTTFSLIERSDATPLDVRGRSVVARLEPFLVDERRVSSWPGTILVGHDALQRRYRLCAETGSILASSAESLCSWVQPSHPEDLCLYVDETRPWLATIAHECDAYLLLSDEEYGNLAPALMGLLEAATDVRGRDP